tara:strand:- start:13752 stop:15248 length:1497 start_codon:yes stop_codon:yes gene_type:complete
MDVIKKSLTEDQGKVDLSMLGNKSQIEDPNYRSLIMVALDTDNEVAINKVLSLMHEDNFVGELSLKDKDNNNCFHYAVKINNRQFLDTIIPRDRFLSLKEQDVSNLSLDERNELKKLRDYFEKMDRVIVDELTYVNDEGNSPLSLLIDGNSDFAVTLLDWYNDLGTKKINSSGDNMLLYSVKQNRRVVFDGVLSLLASKEPYDSLSVKMLEFSNNDNINPLIQSALDVREGAYYCERLLVQGANQEVYMNDNKELNAMMIAALKKNKEVIEVFLLLGNNLKKRNIMLDKLTKAGIVTFKSIVKLVGLSADAATFVSTGIKPGFSELLTTGAEGILKKFKVDQKQKDIIVKLFKYIRGIEMECAWLERVKFDKKEKGFFDSVFGLLKERIENLKKNGQNLEKAITKRFKKGAVPAIKDVYDRIDKQQSNLCSIMGIIDKERLGINLINLSKKMGIIEDSIENIKRQLSILERGADSINDQVVRIIRNMNQQLDPLQSSV